MATLHEMEGELVRRREAAVGLDLKRTNFQIATLQGKIFHAMQARP